MARLVIGTSKAKTVPAVVRDMSPAHYVEYSVSGGKFVSTTNKIIDFTGVTELDVGFTSAYKNNQNLTGMVDMSPIHKISGAGYTCYEMFAGCGNITGVDLSSLTEITSGNTCQYMFNGCVGITSVDISSLTTVPGSCHSMFMGCSGIVGTLDLSSLTTISGYQGCQQMFKGCTGITSVNMSSLTTATGQNACAYMFENCTGITTVDLSSFKSITGVNTLIYAFKGCSSLTGVNLSSLDTMTANVGLYYTFQDCVALTTLSFPALKSTSFGNKTNQFNNMLSGVTGCTVHFPSNLQSVIGSWADVTNGFGGTNTVVSFDLPATE